jgi:hypothetical protein
VRSRVGAVALTAAALIAATGGSGGTAIAAPQSAATSVSSYLSWADCMYYYGSYDYCCWYSYNPNVSICSRYWGDYYG